MSRALLERNRSTGVYAHGEGTVVRLAEMLVSETMAAECGADETFPGFGDGVGVYDDADIEVTSFTIVESFRCGVTVYHASMDLHDGEVSENVIGACVNVESFDLDHLMDNVIFSDNGRRLDPNFEMPVPEPAEPLDWE